MKTKLQNRLSVRLIISISLIMFFILSAYTFFVVKKLDSYLTQTRFESAYNISDIIKKSTRYSMLLNRREDVHQIINTVRSEIGVEEIRIYNKFGTISYSTHPPEINKQVDLTSKACIGCHNSEVPLESLTNQKKIRIYKNAKNQRILGLINPIRNEPDCSNAECHAHSSDVQILGVLDVEVSLDKLDEIIQSSKEDIISASVVLVVFISFFTGLFITVLVNKPLKKIKDGIEEVGNGNLNYRIEMNSSNELGQVAKRFNEMSNKLSDAYEEIKTWTETLNEKVNEKTKELKNIYNQVYQIEKLASLGKLSATVAHELNNPLAGILTLSKLIAKKLRNSQKEKEFKELIEYLDLISNESLRCGQIVKDLLIFSHAEPNEFANENLLKIIDNSVTVINHHLQINGITLIKDYSEEPRIIYCNASKIQQALMSLLINSIEAMTNKGKIIMKLSQEDDNVVMRIIDEGTGISDKDLPYIFEPFYSTKESTSGTGLGLAVVYGIITMHHGKVEIEHTSNQGTTFKLVFPQHKQNT
ncbi:MAG: HAMP domain-containing histidine kinase [Melioribacteraceae bacterium]|nr:HAMP domain-containing histidine kinase [Melioribacteraceae bacterium]